MGGEGWFGHGSNASLRRQLNIAVTKVCGLWQGQVTRHEVDHRVTGNRAGKCHPLDALVAHVFPTFAVGGAQARFAAIANHFGAAFRHIIVSMDGNLACRQRLDPALNATFICVSASKGTMAVNAWRYRRLLKEWKPDVLVTCNWGAIEFALANIVPVTRHLHVVDGFGPEEREIQLPRRVLLRSPSGAHRW
jgi:hypothetical protein